MSVSGVPQSPKPCSARQQNRGRNQRGRRKKQGTPTPLKSVFPGSKSATASSADSQILRFVRLEVMLARSKLVDENVRAQAHRKLEAAAPARTERSVNVNIMLALCRGPALSSRNKRRVQVCGQQRLEDRFPNPTLGHKQPAHSPSAVQFLSH